jgi:hypothetical protein
MGMRPMIAVLLLLLVAGCGGGGSRTATTPDRGVLVRYERRGGLAFTDVVVTVHRDGRGERASAGARPGRTPFTLTPVQLAALRRALADADLAHARSSAGPPPADGYEYRLTSGGHTVRVVQGQVPRALTRVIALLEGRAYAAG